MKHILWGSQLQPSTQSTQKELTGNQKRREIGHTLPAVDKCLRVTRKNWSIEKQQMCLPTQITALSGQAVWRVADEAVTATCPSEDSNTLQWVSGSSRLTFPEHQSGLMGRPLSLWGWCLVDVLSHETVQAHHSPPLWWPQWCVQRKPYN